MFLNVPCICQVIWDLRGLVATLVSKNDEVCIKIEEFRIKNEELCIKNEKFCI